VPLSEKKRGAFDRHVRGKTPGGRFKLVWGGHGGIVRGEGGTWRRLLAKQAGAKTFKALLQGIKGNIVAEIQGAKMILGNGAQGKCRDVMGWRKKVEKRCTDSSPKINGETFKDFGDPCRGDRTEAQKTC